MAEPKKSMEQAIAQLRSRAQQLLAGLEQVLQKLNSLLDSWGSEHLIKLGRSLDSQLSKLKQLDSELRCLRSSLLELAALDSGIPDWLRTQIESQLLTKYLELVRAENWDLIPDQLKELIELVLNHKLRWELNRVLRDPGAWPEWFRAYFRSRVEAELKSQLESQIQQQLSNLLQQQRSQLQLKLQELEHQLRYNALYWLGKLKQIECIQCGKLHSVKLSPAQLDAILRKGEIQISCPGCRSEIQLGLAELISMELESTVKSPGAFPSGIQFLFPDEFVHQLRQDLDTARREVLIFCPFTSSDVIASWFPYLTQLSSKGIKLKLHTLDPNSDSILNKPAHARNLKMLADAGLELILRSNMHEKSVIIDDRIVYLGSLNMLSKHGLGGDFMLRLDQPELVQRLSMALRELARYSEQLQG